MLGLYNDDVDEPGRVASGIRLGWQLPFWSHHTSLVLAASLLGPSTLCTFPLSSQSSGCKPAMLFLGCKLEML